MITFYILHPLFWSWFPQKQLDSWLFYKTYTTNDVFYVLDEYVSLFLSPQKCRFLPWMQHPQPVHPLCSASSLDASTFHVFPPKDPRSQFRSTAITPSREYLKLFGQLLLLLVSLQTNLHNSVQSVHTVRSGDAGYAACGKKWAKLFDDYVEISLLYPVMLTCSCLLFFYAK